MPQFDKMIKLSMSIADATKHLDAVARQLSTVAADMTPFIELMGKFAAKLAVAGVDGTYFCKKAGWFERHILRRVDYIGIEKSEVPKPRVDVAILVQAPPEYARELCAFIYDAGKLFTVKRSIWNFSWWKITSRITDQRAIDAAEKGLRDALEEGRLTLND